MAISQLYSGIVVNHNGPATGTTSIADSVYRTFQLPDDYARGDDVGLLAPLTGFQVFVNIAPGAASAASLTWTLDRQEGDTWISLALGQTTGASADGPVWFTVYLDAPLVVHPSWVAGQFRIGVQGSDEIESVNVA